jgi:hypothetical protein
MHRFTYIFILSALYGLILSGCYTRKVKEKEYITVRDTVITPPVVKMDTTVLFNDRFIYLKDSTGQQTITIERLKNNYIKVRSKCEPEKIIIPITKTIVKSKVVNVENYFWKYIAVGLLLFIGSYLLYSKILPRS